MWRILGFLCVLGVASAQDPAFIEGTVINSLSGEPIRRVSVQTSDLMPVLTDQAGRFRLGPVKPGQYALLAEKAGLYPDKNKPVSSSARDVVIKMVPGAVVSGAVQDEEGQPIPGANVTLLRRAYVGASRQLVLVSYTTTDDRGQYRLHSLRADRYLVRVTGPRIAGMKIPFPTVFYPNASDADKALPVVVGPGQEARGTNFSLRPSVGYRVSGVLRNGVTNTPLTGLSISLTPRGVFSGAMERGPSFVVNDPRGAFHLTDVSPGSYWLSAGSVYENRVIQARLSLEITSDREDVPLTLVPGVEVQGQVRVVGEGALDLSRLAIALESAEDTVGGGGNGRVRTDGGFALQALPPGHYEVNCRSLPAGAYMKSLRVAEQEVNGVDLVGQMMKLDVTISLAGATVNGKTNPAAIVALVPAADAPNRGSRYRVVEADADGKFSLSGAAPGAYTLYAFDQIEPGAWRDDAVLANASGTSVKLEERETKTIDLKAQ